MKAMITTFCVLVVAVLVGQQYIPTAAFAGYGETTKCTSRPRQLTAAQYKSFSDQVLLDWKDYDFSACDENKVTKEYVIKAYDKANHRVLFTIRLPRVDKFSLPPSERRVAWKSFGYNKTVQFKVRALADDGTKSHWSKYFTFTTPVEDPAATLTVADYNEETLRSTIQITWTSPADATNVEMYTLQVFEKRKVAVDNNTYEYHKNLIVSEEIPDYYPSTNTFSVANIAPHLDTTMAEAPYDEYTYVVKLQTVYTVDGKTVKSNADKHKFFMNGNNIIEE